MSLPVPLTLFGLLAILLLIEVPVAFSLGLSSIVVLFIFKTMPLSYVPQAIFAPLETSTLAAIPFFVITGLVLGRSGISKRLIRLASVIVGDLPGGLGIVGVVVSIFFAGISGSGPADVAALGLVLIPAMAQIGYDKGFAAALMAACGGIGIIIPPSIALVIYGIVAETDIPKLFVAGVMPGVLVGLALAVFVYSISLRRGYRSASKRGTLGEIALAAINAFWGLLTPLIILGGIYSGWFTPTEAAAVAVVYSLLVDLCIYREMKWRDVFDVLRQAGITSAQVLVIVACASLFAAILQAEGVVAATAEWIIGVTANKYVLLLLINVLLIIVGCFMDAISIFYIFLPILKPVVVHFGIDPVHFGIIMVVNLAIGQCTPPVGVNLFVASSISNVPINRISRAVLPFIAVEAAALALVTYVPGISLWIPQLLARTR